MTTAADLHALVAKYLNGPMLASLEGDRQRAENGEGDEKLAYGRRLADIVDNNVWPVQVRMEPEDVIAAKKLLLRYFEDLAEAGNIPAMRYAACGYANGDGAGHVMRHENGWGMSAAPDFAKACDWARKAGAAGDPIAKKILPHLEQELAQRKPGP